MSDGNWQVFPAGFEGKSKKYDRGNFPCGNCNLGKHGACRPRLDGAACSCSCPRATEMRLEIEALQEMEEMRGKKGGTNVVEKLVATGHRKRR